MKGYQGQKKNVQFNQNIQINHKIVDSQDLTELFKIHQNNGEIFNFINYSTLYKKIFQLSRDKIDKDLLYQINYGLHNKLLNFQDWRQVEEISRPIAQVSFFLSKILDLQQFKKSNDTELRNGFEEQEDKYYQKIQQIYQILDEQGIKVFSAMNDQEKANFIYQIGKRGKIDMLQNIHQDIEAALNPNMNLKALLTIFYGLTISGFTQNDLIQKIDSILVQKLSQKGAINNMSCRDLSDMIFSYSKNQNIIGDSQIFNLIENAAALPFDSDYTKGSSSSNQKYQSWLQESKFNDKKKIASLFRNDIEIDSLSICTLFNSIANFNENKFSYDFYERFENIFIYLRFKNTRQLANAFRGMALYYTPSDQLFGQIERQALYFLEKKQFDNDLHSFSTILYFMSLHSKGTLKFYNSFEQFTIKNLKSFNMRQLNFIFFSFKFSLHYHLERQNKDLIIGHLISCFPQMTLEEMSSIIQNFRQFEEDNQRRELFFQLVNQHLETINFIEKHNDEHLHTFFWSIFTAFNKQFPSQDPCSKIKKIVEQFKFYITELEKQVSDQNYLPCFKNIQKIQLEDLVIVFQDDETITHLLQNIQYQLFR
ncbi:hypothetical protein ABPG72_012547 [Tetrahymena utriculariae]